jgi:hypothetical protein
MAVMASWFGAVPTSAARSKDGMPARKTSIISLTLTREKVFNQFPGANARWRFTSI